MKRYNLYLAGAMEKSEDQGATWRDIITSHFTDRPELNFIVPEIPVEETEREEWRKKVKVSKAILRDTYMQEWKLAETVQEYHTRTKTSQGTLQVTGTEKSWPKNDSVCLEDLKSDQLIKGIVPKDALLIRNADAIIAYIEPGTLESHGTISELSMAYILGLPYYVVIPHRSNRKQPVLSHLGMWAASAFVNASLVIIDDGYEDHTATLNLIITDLNKKMTKNPVIKYTDSMAGF